MAQATDHPTGLSAGSIHSLMKGLPISGPYIFQVLSECKGPQGRSTGTQRPGDRSRTETQGAHAARCCVVTDMKAVMSKTDPNAKKRYRVSVSDGQDFITMMLATDDEILPDHSIISCADCIVNEVSWRRWVGQVCTGMDRYGSM
jgi:hypothetical protein